MIIETFRQALQNVWSNKLRTFLTMLGIIIGVMAVIVIVGLGNGMTQSMRDSFSALGTNALSIQVWGYGSRTASVEDVYKIADKNKELISAVSPQIDFSNNTPKVGTTTYRYGTSVYGVDEHYAEMKNYTLAQGRGLQHMDNKDNVDFKRVIAALGYDYALSKRTAVYAMTGWSQEKVENGTTEAKPNGYEFTTGIVHRF